MIRYGCLVMYVVFMFMKNIQEYINQKELDPRLSFQKQMRLVYERPKAFMRGCIDVSGSTIGIHHDQPIPDGPYCMCIPNCARLIFCCSRDILKSRLVLSLARKLSGCRFSEIGCV